MIKCGAPDRVMVLTLELEAWDVQGEAGRSMFVPVAATK